MFPNFVSVMECLNRPETGCLLAPSMLVLYAPFVLAFIAGFFLAVRHGRALRGIARKLLGPGLVMMLISLIGVVGFFNYAPNAPLGVEKRPGVEAMWIFTIYLFGIGFGLVFAALGFRMGGGLARLTGFASRLGRPGVVIAIDGPAASGKGTLAKRIADHYRLPCLDTGLLYRAVARDVLDAGQSLDDVPAAVAAAKALDPKTFVDPALRGETAGEAASVVAKEPDVRAALLDYQRSFAKDPRGAVLDGRDIGTIVCPDADVKIFVIASPAERARRRHKELAARGGTLSYDDVLEDIHRRDARDMGRDVAPLWPAKDAVTLDTTDMNADEAYKAARTIVEAVLAAKPA